MTLHRTGKYIHQARKLCCQKEFFTKLITFLTRREGVWPEQEMAAPDWQVRVSVAARTVVLPQVWVMPHNLRLIAAHHTTLASNDTFCLRNFLRQSVSLYKLQLCHLRIVSGVDLSFNSNESVLLIQKTHLVTF